MSTEPVEMGLPWSAIGGADCHFILDCHGFSVGDVWELSNRVASNTESGSCRFIQYPIRCKAWLRSVRGITTA